MSSLLALPPPSLFLSKGLLAAVDSTLSEGAPSTSQQGSASSRLLLRSQAESPLASALASRKASVLLCLNFSTLNPPVSILSPL